MLFSTVGAGERVLLVWADLGAEPQHLQTTVEQIQSSVGKDYIILTVDHIRENINIHSGLLAIQSRVRGQITHFI